MPHRAVSLEQAVRELNAIYVVSAPDAALAMADTIVAILLGRRRVPHRRPRAAWNDGF